MRSIFLLLFLLNPIYISAQKDKTILSLEEYLGYVKKYHPIVKQAELITSKGEAKLLKTRGAFDPKIEVDYKRKKFKNTTYYNKLNTTFKIPVWYGLDFKANYQNNEGVYLNPEENTSDQGLYSVGVSVSLAKGLLINKRMATLKKAKIYNQISKSKQEITVNKVLHGAIDNYLTWLKNYQEYIVFTKYQVNAKERLLNVKKSFFEGDKPAIDTLEAAINLEKRSLILEKSNNKLIKSAYEVSNNLWLDNNIPVDLQNNIIPDIKTNLLIDRVLNTSLLSLDISSIKNHPKIKTLELKKQNLIIEKRLKMNNLLPKVNFEYNLLSSKTTINSLITDNYKSGLNISIPVLLRKERGDLKLARIKLQDIDFNLTSTKFSLKNKINSILAQINSYEKQFLLADKLVLNYSKLVSGEEKKFSLGEGSLFLINYREIKLIEAELEKLKINYNLLSSKVSLVSNFNKLI